jgi:hypothetical protein
LKEKRTVTTFSVRGRHVHLPLRDSFLFIHRIFYLFGMSPKSNLKKIENKKKAEQNMKNQVLNLGDFLSGKARKSGHFC